MSFDDYEAFWLGMHGYGPLSFLLYRALTRSSPKQNTERKLGRHSVEYLQQQAERKKRLKRD